MTRITTRDFVAVCRAAMITADVILPGRPNVYSRMAGHVIVETVASLHGLTAADLLGPSRLRRLAWPRQEAMATIHAELGWSLSRIGRLFGRDHTTVIHGIRAHEGRQ